MIMETLTLKELVNKSSIFERVKFMDSYKKWQRQWCWDQSSHIVTSNYELIQTVDGECEIQLLYIDQWKTYQLYKDTMNDILDSAMFDRFLNEVDYMFDVYETAQTESSFKHM